MIFRHRPAGWNGRRQLRLWGTLFCALFFGCFAQAADILCGRFFTVPQTLYVNQAFTIHFELEVTFGGEVEDLRISDFPNDPDLIEVGRLENTSRNRITRDGQAIDVLQYTAQARCLKPVNRTFHPDLQCMLVERRNAGFFSHWQSYPKQKNLTPFTLTVRPLPETGRPAAFSGAVGSFRLNGHLPQTRVHPGDILTLTLDLSGQGWLGKAALPSIPASPLFKIYPPKEVLRENARLKTQQVFIPQNTNAADIAALPFCFFNPVSGRYEETSAGPFHLTVQTDTAGPKADEVRVIDTAQPVRSEMASQTVTIERVNQTLRHAVPLLVGCAGALAAFFVFFTLFAAHKRLAFGIGLIVLAAGIGAGYALSRKTEVSTRTLARRTDARFAPSRGAAPLFALNPNTTVIPLENAGTWIRIDAAGRRGWIPADALTAETAEKNAPAAH